MPGVSTPSSATNYSGGRLALAGVGYIAGQAPGILTVAGTPAVRRIELYDELTGRLVGVTQSAANGTYRFDNLNPARTYRVIAFDNERIYNSVIRSYITPFVDE